MVSDSLGKKTGNQRQEDFEVEDYLQLLQPLVDGLESEIPEAKYDRKSVAHLIFSILQFMEDALGINALPPKPYPKLPAQLFRDFSVDGPLFTVAKRCQEYKIRNQLKKIDFLNPQMRKNSMELLNLIRQEFVKQGLIKYPKVFLHPSLQVPQVAKLKEQVLELKGTLAESMEEQGVTHIVYPFGSAGDPDDGQQYMRTLDVMGLQALIHWWYTPDSYDEWISRQTAPLKVEKDYDPGIPWKVYIRWLTDSVRYNEWVNPIDYETEEFQEQLEKANIASQQQKEKLTAKETENQEGAVKKDDDQTQITGHKRREREEGEIPADSLDDTEGGVGISLMETNQPPVPLQEVEAGTEEIIEPGVKKQKLQNIHPTVMDGTATTENISLGQSDNWIQELPDYQFQNVDDDMTAKKVIKKELYRVPAHSAWFRWDKVHEREEKSMPDFFNPIQQGEEFGEEDIQNLREQYMEKRNLIIDKYRENPERYLTFSMVKRQLSGDVVSLKRIWDFLNSWGLINYFAKNRGNEQQQQQQGVEIQAVSEKPSSSLVSATTFAPTPDALYRFSWPSMEEASKAAQSGGNNVNLITKQHKLAGMTPSKDKVVFYCNAMPWIDCTKERYHCTKFPDVDLCPLAYSKGYFPPGCSKKDFVKIENNQLVTGGEVGDWSEQETLLMLEGLEMFGDKWADVAEHVGTKSQIQCIMHFLQLPIEEQFLEEGGDDNERGVALEQEKEQYQQTTENSQNDNDQQNATKNFDSSALTAAQQNAAESDNNTAPPIPFSDTNNPLMAQIAFLTSMVSPKVAAAAAQRALEVLSEEDPIIQEDPQNSFNSPSLTNAKVKAAAGSALSAAAVKAKLLADNEEREIQRLVVAAVDAQMKKVEIKLKYLEELEGVMEQEKNALTNARKQYEVEANQLKTKHQDAQTKLQMLRQQLAQRQDEVASTTVVPPQQQQQQQTTPQQQQQQQPSEQQTSLEQLGQQAAAQSTPLQYGLQQQLLPQQFPPVQLQQQQQQQFITPPPRQQLQEQQQELSMLGLSSETPASLSDLPSAVTIEGQIPQVEDTQNLSLGDKQKVGEWITVEDNMLPQQTVQSEQTQQFEIKQELSTRMDIDIPKISDLEAQKNRDSDQQEVPPPGSQDQQAQQADGGEGTIDLNINTQEQGRIIE